MFWTSTECWKASKIAIATILPCLRRYQFWNVTENVTKRERDLALAKEALQWRRQQTPIVNNLPPAVQYQGAKVTISHLQTRRQLATGMGRRSVVSFDCHEPTEQILQPKIIQVKAVKENNQKSEVLLKCANLKLMDNLDDPIRKIDSFKTSGAEIGPFVYNL